MAGANRMNWPRRGSLQVWPRVRARKHVPRMRNWPAVTTAKLLGFVGYKVGMTHVMFKDANPGSPTRNQNIFMPVSLVECPPMRPLSLRFYQKSYDGLVVINEVFAENADKKRFHVKQAKREVPQAFDKVKLVVYTTPGLTGFGKKRPDVLELGLGGSPQDAVKLGLELLKKEIKVSDVFREHQVVDVHAVSKGKGFQGTVKRFGVKIRQHKSEKVKRGVGTLGPWRPRHVLFSVAQPGKMGYHTRTEYNKQVLRIMTKPDEVNPKGGFVRYGLVRNDCVVLKGSIIGPRKRAIVLTEPVRPVKPQPGEVTYISLESQQ